MHVWNYLRLMKQKFSNVPLGTKSSIAGKQILAHSAHSWENLWEKVPLLCSCSLLLFQNCFGGALNAWSLSLVQIHPSVKQEPNWLSSMVLPRKNCCVVHSTAFVAGSHQEMSLFPRCFFVGSSLTLNTFYALSKLMISIGNVYWGCWGHNNIFFEVATQYLLVNSSETGAVWRLQESFPLRSWAQI